MADWHNSLAWKKARAHAKTVLDPVCVICNKDLAGWDWTIDHITPPGDNEPNHSLENLQSMCRECNGRKQDRTLKRVPWHNKRWKDTP